MRKHILLVMLAAMWCGCADTTSIMLTIDGDLRIGTDVEMLDVIISDASGPVRQQTFDLRQLDSLPQTVLIMPGQQVTNVIDIEVRALVGGDEVLTASRRTRFETDQQIDEVICLYRRCIGSASDECADGTCSGADGDADVDTDADGDEEVDGDVEADGDADEDVCVPECGARVCGPDPVCEMSCGECDGNETCNPAGLCECNNEECDGECCGAGETCSALDGTCCSPDCGTRECGLDPVCGLESCGACEGLEDCGDDGMCGCMFEECTDGCCFEGEVCSRSRVCCLPDCGDRRCGMDILCGVMSCGECPDHAGCNALGLCECRFTECEGACCAEGQVCSIDGACCDASCGTRVCGMDPVCGVVPCGSCGSNETCTADGACACSHIECAGACCAADEICVDGACCNPDCGDRNCGMDPVCGTESCGECDETASCNADTGHCECLFETCDDVCCLEGEVCNAGECCVPDCAGRECGSNGCGGTCGPDCPMGESCTVEGRCLSYEWVTVEAGSFEMGSSPFEAGRRDTERPHNVTLTHDFVILSTEVTQYEFALAMFYAPSFHSACGFMCPVERVNWHEAAAFANVWSDREGRGRCYDCTGSAPATINCAPAAAYATPYDCPGYRLPTEAEWEYAARAGTLTATYAGNLDMAHLACEEPNPALDGIAWFCGNSGGATHLHALREPNAWGIYDMLGNATEWVHDRWGDYPAGAVTDPYGPATGSPRVIRGGGYPYDAANCRAAFRWSIDPNLAPNFGRFIDLGFRVVRTVAP
jgi:formylglycine-generating enzyme required for sulfatase activity